MVSACKITCLGLPKVEILALGGSREGNVKLYTQVINTNLLLWSIHRFSTHTAELCTMFGTSQQFTAYLYHWIWVQMTQTIVGRFIRRA